MKRKSEMIFKKKEKEVFKNEKVGFQEVVHKPPTLRVCFICLLFAISV